MKQKSKAQIETMGLLVIVILVSIIMFFVLMFIINVDPVIDKNPIVRKEAISNFGPTMLETTVNCSMEGKVRKIRDLLADCGFEHEIMCNGVNSCLAANETIVYILNLTLDKWDYKYTMTIEKGQTVILPIVLNCTSAKSSVFEETPFGTTHGTMAMRIRTC